MRELRRVPDRMCQEAPSQPPVHRDCDAPPCKTPPSNPPSTHRGTYRGTLPPAAMGLFSRQEQPAPPPLLDLRQSLTVRRGRSWTARMRAL